MPFRGDARSDEAATWRAWYKTRRWKALRLKQLTDEPLCRMCRLQGRVTAATVCDHIGRHHGDPIKFWHGPFQSLCKPHHDATKQREELVGFSNQRDAEGWPVDPNHPANRTGGGSKVKSHPSGDRRP